MIMSRLLQVTNIGPFVFGDIIHLTSFTRLIRILATNCINEILGFKFKFSVKMSQLMSTPWMIHEGSLLNSIGLLVDNIAFI